MTKDEEILQKALGTYPTHRCAHCGQLKYIDEFSFKEPPVNYVNRNGDIIYRCDVCNTQISKELDKLIKALSYGRLDESE